MKVKLLLVMSIVIVGLSGAYVVKLLNQDFVLTKASQYDATLDIWTTTPELSAILAEFQTEENIKVNVTQFQNAELLLDELEMTKLTDDTPELVEVALGNEIGVLKRDHRLYPVEDLVDKKAFHSAAAENFSDNGTLHAIPLGIEVPSLYINRALVREGALPSVYPFQPESVLKKFSQFQREIKAENPSKPFWMFHFDDQGAWYRNAHRLSGGTAGQWDALMERYGLVPQFDSHMAITRFANAEVGVLVSNSDHLQSLQQLIGNRFEFEIQPFLMEPGDEILVSGNALALMRPPGKNEAALEKLFEFLNTEEAQLPLLESTGWLPAQTESLGSPAFIHELPMYKHLQELIEYEGEFIGQEIE